MKDDWNWVTKVIMHKENTYAHYLALKKLIKLFELKWSGHKNKVAYDLYVNYLKARLKIEFRRD